MIEKVTPAMQTADGEWRVDLVTRGQSTWYRLVHGDDVIDWLTITTLERLLGEAGVDMGQLEAAA